MRHAPMPLGAQHHMARRAPRGATEMPVRSASPSASSFGGMTVPILTSLPSAALATRPGRCGVTLSGSRKKSARAARWRSRRASRAAARAGTGSAPPRQSRRWNLRPSGWIGTKALVMLSRMVWRSLMGQVMVLVAGKSLVFEPLCSARLWLRFVVEQPARGARGPGQPRAGAPGWRKGCRARADRDGCPARRSRHGRAR